MARTKDLLTILVEMTEGDLGVGLGTEVRVEVIDNQVVPRWIHVRQACE